jgi:methylmalonyl-CoA/ethylmalonyl-CoA epimerase
LTFLGTEVVQEQKVRVAIFDIGGVRIELVEPLSDDSPVSNFLKKRGGGIHHIAYEVDDLEGQVEVFTKNHIRLLNPETGKGVSGSKIIFAHPGDLSGVLMELVEKKK